MRGPGHATISAKEYRELIEERSAAMMLAMERGSQIAALENRLAAAEERARAMTEQYQKQTSMLVEFERFFADPNNKLEKEELENWRRHQAERRAAQTEGGAE